MFGCKLMNYNFQGSTEVNLKWLTILKDCFVMLYTLDVFQMIVVWAVIMIISQIMHQIWSKWLQLLLFKCLNLEPLLQYADVQSLNI